MNLLSIFLQFMKIGAMAFGGAYASISIVEKEIVNVLGWMDYNDFGNLLAIDELTPGPIIINSATFIGMTLAGVPGAILASLGAIIPACIVSTILILVYRKYKNIKVLDNIVSALKCMALGMIINTFINIFTRAVFVGEVVSIAEIDYLILVMAAASFFLLKKFKLNPIFIMLGCGAIYLLVHGFILG